MTGPVNIMVMSGPYDGQVVALNAPNNPKFNDSYLLGRRDYCDLSFPYDRWVSGEHARLFQVDDQWFIQDLKSTNGTFLGIMRPNETFAGREQIEVMTIHPIQPGQLIQLGRVWIRLQKV